MDELTSLPHPIAPCPPGRCRVNSRDSWTLCAAAGLYLPFMSPYVNLWWLWRADTLTILVLYGSFRMQGLLWWWYISIKCVFSHVGKKGERIVSCFDQFGEFYLQLTNLQTCWHIWAWNLRQSIRQQWTLFVKDTSCRLQENNYTCAPARRSTEDYTQLSNCLGEAHILMSFLRQSN